MLEELLLKTKLVSPEELALCKTEAEKTQHTLSQIIIKRGLLDEDDLLEAISKMFHIPRVALSKTPVTPEAVKEIPAKTAQHYHIMPFGFENGSLKIASAVPLDIQVLDEIRVVLGKDIFLFLAPEWEVEKALKDYYGMGAQTLDKLKTEAPINNAATSAISDVATADIEKVEDASLVQLVNEILLEAYNNRATDIHFEPMVEDFRLRYRIDGLLHEGKMATSMKRYQAAITSRLKIMSNLSIAEKRLPQDGRIKVRVAGKEMDLRVSTLPTALGESINIRILTARQLLDLAHLGFSDADAKKLNAFLDMPHGIIFLTGPTGSGKTTTLYAFLQRINKADQKIITLEDPIEYQLPGITQMQILPKIGLTFAAGLRSVLRHDPDVIMVGEVRDAETAEIAIRVALTGHLVFSSLHTNDAPGAITRLQDIGVEPYLLSSSILCVVAQRLVRTLCLQCRKEKIPTPDTVAEFGLSPQEAQRPLMQSVGCPACKNTGFQGRTTIYEILPITLDIRDLIFRRSPANLIRDKALSEGMRTLRQCGWEKVRQGLTTPEEVIRVTLRDSL